MVRQLKWAVQYGPIIKNGVPEEPATTLTNISFFWVLGIYYQS